MFRRRAPRNIRQKLVNVFYPGGGWARSASYVMHRLRRLPDSPERIAKGIAAGVAISFTPLFGFHFVAAASIAWVLRGNILAALLATFFGNPVTFPMIVFGAIELGGFLLGGGGPVSAGEAMRAFGGLWSEVGQNAIAIFTSEPFHWEKMSKFGDDIFLPYLLGGSLLGTVFGIAAYFLSLPVIRAYRKRRLKKLQARFELARKQLGE